MSKAKVPAQLSSVSVEALQQRLAVLERDLVAEREENRILALQIDHAQLIRSLIDNLPDSVFIKDLDGRYLINNLAHCFTLGGGGPNDITGKTDFDLLPAATAEAVQTAEQAVLVSGMPHISTEERLIDSAGSERWHSTTRVPLWDRDHKIVGLVGISRDITDQKRAAGEIELAGIAAEAIIRGKTEFLANMSHEVRTPLNGVLGMTELALDTELTPEQREYLEMIKISAGSLLGLIGDILDYSKIEAGRFELERVPFSLREVVGETMDAAALSPRASQLELVCSVEQTAPDDLVGDAHRLRQVLESLIGNAVKFTPEGEVLVEISVDFESSEDVVLRFRVKDTGIGIPADKHETVFDAFSQVDNELTRKYGGSGLGLSIVQQLVGLMGGRIWMDSEEGSGTSFEFTARFEIAHVPSPPINADHHLTGLSVLVVDDNLSSRRVIEEILRTRGIKVQHTSSAESGLETLRSARASGEPIAIALVDSSLPGIGGFEIAEAAKADPDLVKSVLMMIAPRDRQEHAQQCREMGMTSYLVKPIKHQALLDAVRAAAVRTLFTEPSVSRSKRVGGPKTRKLRLLLAEDNKVNQLLASRILEKRGHLVTAVENGRQAADAAAGGEFDLVLMDVQMPVLDGIAATREIRAAEAASGRHIPIVAMTAYAMEGDRERCLSAGMDFYVAKPIQPLELIEVVESLTNAADCGEPDGENMAGSKIFDRKAALAIVEGDPELMLELIGLFFEQSPELMSEVHDHIKAGNAPGLLAAAHSIRGSAGNFSAAGVFETADALEQMAKSGDISKAEPLAAKLQDQVLELTSALAAYRDEIREG